MATVKTAISLQEPLFARANRLAAEMKISRSGLFALALEEFMERRRNQELLAQINAAYDDAPDENEERLLRGMRHARRKIVVRDSLEGGEW